jgi:putative DNA primase/helicase
MSAFASGAEFAQAMGPVARQILGEPTEENRAKRELRYGTRGSLKINLADGTWYDNEAGDGGGVLKFVQVKKSLDKAGAIHWLQEQGHINAPKPKSGSRRIVETYDYPNAAGELLFQVVRYEPKDFRQRRADGAWTTADVEKVLYRLPRVIAAVAAAGEAIFVVEGEKAVHALESFGLTATCSPGGAGKWRPEYSPCLRGADVILLPDNDEPGRKHVAQVGSYLSGVAARVRVLALPGLPEKGDIVD